MHITWPRYSFKLLLGALLFFFLFDPFLERLPHGPIIGIVAMYVILAISIYCLSHKQITRYIAAGMIALSLTLDIVCPTDEPSIGGLLSIATKALFFLLFLVLILQAIFSEKKITTDTILGVICGYFVLGLIWSFAYHILETVDPGSFAPLPSYELSWSNNHIFIYYSFVTLTTLGFGDIAPLTQTGQSLTIFEAITGQIYLTVLVAQFVGLRITQKLQQKAPL